MKLTLNIQNRQNKVIFSPKKVKAIILTALKNANIKVPAEINLLFTTNKEIQKFNAEYLGKNCPTDVITFDLSKNKKQIISDIIISADTAISNAKNYQTTAVSELYLYAAHGILHILGNNDNTVSKRKLMQKKAEQILSTLDCWPRICSAGLNLRYRC